MSRLKELRKEKQLSQRQLSEILGVSEDYIYMIERGLRSPSIKLAKKICAFFDISLDELFKD